ncbi:DUF4376 domain-containing protein [uncultured Deefgea sp.]|uniref:DUF4376 domain-containing protein n=1 Tax=uncultured Deefgea sp. TaxID=1304914 RepID=UPI0025928F21|nr:DUF4376 domain-containing protein [uncultured Deefgea sp.]
MKRYARIASCAVVEIFETDRLIAELFHPDLIWVEIPNAVDVECGWAYVNENFIAPITEANEQILARKIAEINAWRDQQEQTGFVFGHAEHTWDGGVAVATRLQNSVKMPGLLAGFYWTDAGNSDVPMTLEQLQQLNAAHDQAIFNQGFRIHDRQRTMKAEVEKLSGEALAGYVAGWPA